MIVPTGRCASASSHSPGGYLARFRQDGPRAPAHTAWQARCRVARRSLARRSGCIRTRAEEISPLFITSGIEGAESRDRSMNEDGPPVRTTRRLAEIDGLTRLVVANLHRV